MSIEVWKFDANLLDSHSSEIAAAFSLDVGSSKITTNCGTNFTHTCTAFARTSLPLFYLRLVL